MPSAPYQPPNRVPTGAGVLVGSGTHHQAFAVVRDLPPVWGRLTSYHPDDEIEDQFEWEEVFRDDAGKWQTKSEYLPQSFQSVRDADPGSGSVAIYNPAVEINSHNVPLGIVVRLYPGRMVTDNYGNTHRPWYFSFHKLRPFRLLQKLLPVSLPGQVSNEGKHPGEPDYIEEDRRYIHYNEIEPPVMAGPSWWDTTIKGEWLDEVGQEVWLFPRHKNVHRLANQFFTSDQIFSLGIGYAPSDYTDGTRGWAEYAPHGTIIRYDEDNEPVWRGEWQIVSLDAELIALALISDGTIQPGEMGIVEIQGIQKGEDGPEVNPFGSAFGDVIVFNDLPVPLTNLSYHKIHYHRSKRIWLPVTPLASEHGESVYANVTENVTDEFVWHVVPFDTKISLYGEGVRLHDNALRNVGEVALVGTVNWAVTARRLIGPDAEDIDSRLRVALFNNGVLVDGTESEMTSSRRNASGEGANAVNNASGSVIQELLPGQELTVRMQKFNPAKDPPGHALPADFDGSDDSWVTVENMCHLTYNSKAGVFLDRS